ncbi:hypothetical protein GCM10027342_43930 [Photobacterium alginatilyticum]
MAAAEDKARAEKSKVCFNCINRPTLNGVVTKICFELYRVMKLAIRMSVIAAIQKMNS